MELIEIALKLLLAVALGGLIGMERESSQKPAGFRTNILICVGAAMMMILSGLILQGQEGSRGDLTRIAAGVITGIGFIGAGTIIQGRGSVIGLTSAATIWAVAGLGLVIGAGYYWIAAIYTVLVFATLLFLGRVERFPLRRAGFHYRIKTKRSKTILNHIKKLALHEGIKFQNLTLKNEEDHTFVDFSFKSSDEKERNFNKNLLSSEQILEIQID